MRKSFFSNFSIALKTIAILFCLHMVSSTQASAQLTVIPDAVGFGVNTHAGRFGEVIRVTTLNDSGPGSLREAVQATQPRTIIFDVGGTIYLQDNIVIRNPFITIAGQTAPSPGITLAYAGMIIKTHDVLVQHLRIRPGDRQDGPAKSDRDALAMTGDSQGITEVYNVVIDHCSLSWGTDETASTWYPNVHDLTIINTIISEGLMDAGHPQGRHSMGYLVGDHTQNAAIINNLFAHNANRNPLLKGDVTAYIANNVVYNYGNEPMVIGDLENSGPSKATIVGNDIIPGPSSGPEFGLRISPTASVGTQVFLDDNKFPGQSSDPWSIALVSTNFSVQVDSPPVTLSTPMNVVPSADIRSSVLNNVGARPADRDDIDTRIINDVRSGTGSLIDSQEQVGGWSDAAATRRVLELPTNPSGDDDGNGYTNLEQWLHALSDEVEGHVTERPGKIGVPDVNVSESVGSVEMVVSLDRALSQDVEILVYTQPKTAINGRDFYGMSKRLLFEAGTVSKIVSLQILDDDVAEPSEYFIFSLHTLNNDRLAYSKRVAAIVVRDDD